MNETKTERYFTSRDSGTHAWGVWDRERGFWADGVFFMRRRAEAEKAAAEMNRQTAPNA